MNISEDVIKMIKIPEISIPTINIPNIIGYGEKQRLEKISRAFEELKSLEKSLQDETTPSLLKRSVSIQSFILYAMALITICISVKLIYRHYLKIRRRNQNANTTIYISKAPSNNASAPVNPNPIPISRNSRFYANKPNNTNTQNNASSILDLPNDQ